MSPRTETAALVTLLRSGKQPWQSYADLVEEAGSAFAVLEQETAADTDGQTTLFDADGPAADQPTGATALANATAEITAWEQAGMRLLTVLDRDYPENLRAVHDRPPLIFLAGRLEPADARSLAVVGARTPSQKGVAVANAIAAHLVDTGYTVASGLAAGIDTAAHTAALNAGGRTIAVIGTGLTRSYPPQNAALQRRIATEGAVISQFWPDAPPSRRSFPMRNAVMSGLTLGTIVVEASHTSGSRMQARLALAHGRPVFLTQRLVEQHDWARAFASKPGTHVVGRPAEITAVVERLTSTGTLVV